MQCIATANRQWFTCSKHRRLSLFWSADLAKAFGPAFVQVTFSIFAFCYISVFPHALRVEKRTLLTSVCTSVLIIGQRVACVPSTLVNAVHLDSALLNRIRPIQSLNRMPLRVVCSLRIALTFWKTKKLFLWTRRTNNRLTEQWRDSERFAKRI